MNYSSISDFIIGFVINFAVVWMLFAILSKGTKVGIVYMLSLILSFCVFYFSVKLTNDQDFMVKLGTTVLLTSIFFGLIFGTICYFLCGKMFKGKFNPQDE